MREKRERGREGRSGKKRDSKQEGQVLNKLQDRGKLIKAVEEKRQRKTEQMKKTWREMQKESRQEKDEAKNTVALRLQQNIKREGRRQ